MVDKESKSENNDEQTRRKNLEVQMLNQVANSSAIFKSQQKDEPELSIEEKTKIASELLEKSHSQFLSRFGMHLNLELLEYFAKNPTNKDQDYEVEYHINRLKRYYNNRSRRIDRKNRRYEVLKSLVEKGEYFSEVAMMKRNPLLYDELVGRYLTEKEIETRDSFDDKNTTYVNVLMEGIERDLMKKLKKEQEDADDEVLEENDSDSESDDDTSESEGEQKTNRQHLSLKEKDLLKKEFVSQMYQSFLNGKDDFDYSTIDENEAYDNVDLRGQDEEEKYFDSESPDLVLL